MEDIIPREQHIRVLYSPSTKTSAIRIWNGLEHDTISWDFTGSSIKIYIQRKSVMIHCPIISLSQADKEKLPYNSCVFSSSSTRFIDEYDLTVFPPAKIFLQDPYTGPMAVARPRPTPRPVASPVARPVASPRPTLTKLPPHITKLVLADSISKNECCPITCDAITQDNASVTSCGHVFTTVAINHWLTLPSSKGECPVCKQACCV
jgi:hypothetical protein